MRDFWLSCGHHLLDRDGGGGLVVTPAFLKAYLARPELTPPDNADIVERTFHAALLNDPFRSVGDDEISALQDPDARENWQVILAFRDRLLRHPTIEAAYLDLVRHGTRGTPALFVDQLTHVILRNVLDGCDDALILRAAELFFRAQVLTLHEGSLIAADEELVAGSTPNAVSPLISMLGLPASATVALVSSANTVDYFERSDRFDMAIDLTAGREGLAALASVLERWIAHLLALEVEVEPIVEMRDASFAWYVGLDAVGTRIGDALWNGEELDTRAREQVVGLFRLTFADPSLMSAELRGEAVYLILAMSPERGLKMKPQNLVAGLPVKQPETVS
jgi:hypothetical protein